MGCPLATNKDIRDHERPDIKKLNQRLSDLKGANVGANASLPPSGAKVLIGGLNHASTNTFKCNGVIASGNMFK
jgi:hypothetical protein